MLLYLCDQQLYVLFEAVQESLQGAGVGSAALPSPNFWQSSMFVLNLSKNLQKTKNGNQKCSVTRHASIFQVHLKPKVHDIKKY